jgi:putative lipoic acid-binding regulatory protein
MIRKTTIMKSAISMVLFPSVVCAGLFLGSILSTHAQGALANGYTYQAAIAPVGDQDTWTFNASIGDRLIVRVGNATNASGWPKVRLYGPNGALLDSAIGSYDAQEVEVTATNTGQFQAVVDWGTGVGEYRLTLAQSPGAITVAPGDEGGPLTNGFTHAGVITVGDLDVWTINANSGDRLVVRLGDATNSAYEPGLRIYGPNGALLDSATGAYNAQEVEITATNSGQFLVLVEGDSGSGAYRITLAQSPGAITVAPGDEGGPLTNGFTHTGVITVGDLDVWTFNACAGDIINLQLTELSDESGFSPTLRLYAPNGVLTNSVTGSTSAQINRLAPLTGTYTLVAGDNDGSGAGTYQLTGTGVSAGLILCQPLVQGTNVVLRSAGGPAYGNYVLLAATNIALPANDWTPIHTNQFNAYGVFTATNTLNPLVRQEFFRVKNP